jgi:hypothetical protein
LQWGREKSRQEKLGEQDKGRTFELGARAAAFACLSGGGGEGAEGEEGRADGVCLEDLRGKAVVVGNVMSIGAWPVAAQQLARIRQEAWPTRSDNLTKQ